MSFKSPKELRQEINLLDLCIVGGYQIDKSKSSAKWIRLVNNTLNDKIIVNTKENTYFNQNIAEDKGDVIQFKSNRINGGVFPDSSKETFYKALVELNHNLGISLNTEQKDLLNGKNKYIQKKERLSNLQDKQWNHEAIRDYSFLTDKRAIDLKTLQSPIFEGCLFNTYFKLPNDHLITNYGFGKFKNNNLVGLEVRNDTLKSIVGDHDGIFITNTSKIEKLDYLFYAESAIDAISYYEILSKHPEFNTEKNNFALLSFGGNLYESKAEVIINELERLPVHPLTKFVSITDNDFQKAEEKNEGKKYDVMLTAALINKYRFPLEFTSDNLYFKLSFDKQEINQDTLNNIIQKQNTLVDATIPIDERFGKYVIVKEKEDKKELYLPRGLSLDNVLFTDFLKVINAQNLYIPHKSKGKDWNEDLQKMKQKKSKQKKVEEPKQTKKNGLKR